jgi:spore maturation protein CgeB
VRFLACQPGPSFSVHDVYVGYVEALRALGHQVVEFPFADILTFYGEVFFQVTDDQFRRALDSETATAFAADRLCAALYKVRPDVLFCVSGFFLPHQLLDTARAYGTKVVVYHTETPYENERQLALAAHADLNLMSDPTGLERFKEVSRQAIYMPHGVPAGPPQTRPARSTLACDFAFVGTGYPVAARSSRPWTSTAWT